MKTLELEALERIQKAFKDVLTERMLKDSSKMPTFEDGFYERIGFLSYSLYKRLALGMASGLKESDFLNAMELYTLVMGEVLIAAKAYHLATHIYEKGTPECSSVKNIEQELSQASNIAKAAIKKEVSEVLGTFPSAKKNWTN